jgi:hypothetical protein
MEGERDRVGRMWSRILHQVPSLARLSSALWMICNVNSVGNQRAPSEGSRGRGEEQRRLAAC